MSRVLFTLHVALVVAGLIFIPRAFSHNDHAAKARIHADKGTIVFFKNHPWLLRPRHTRDWAIGAIEVARRRIERMEPKPDPAPAVDGCLSELIGRESGWNVKATNPTTGAYGLPQALPGSKMATAGADWRTNAATQIRWMIGYVKKYGGSCAALAFQKSNGWY